MNKYEQLLCEYGDELDITERDMKNKGLYSDNTIWINRNLHTAEKTCILAEEIGHYETSVGDILDQKDVSNAKQEGKARAWAYDKLIPIEELKRAFDTGCRATYEIADYLDVDEGFLKNSLDHYTSKHGQSFFGQIDEETKLQTLFCGSTTRNVPKWLLDLIKG